MEGALVEVAGSVRARGAALSVLDERTLIRQAQRGDRGAFEELVRLYDRHVLRLALQMVRSPEEAKDLYQEAFLKVYRALPRFRFESSFSTWLYRVVTNACLDALRRKSKRREVQAPFGSEGDETEFFHTVAEERPTLNPERQMQARQIGERIEAALDRLNPRERMVFEMKHYQGLKLRVIGELCGTSEATVKNCLFRATRKLRGELSDLVAQV